MVALAAGNFLGPIGFWLIIVAAVLSMLSALNANLLAASRVSLTMARDRSLPEGPEHPHDGQLQVSEAVSTSHGQELSRCRVYEKLLR